MDEHLAIENKRGLSSAALLVVGTFFMESINGTVIATALPDMTKSFGVYTVDLNIGISACLITLVVLIPASGWIVDCFGARKVFTLALAIFTLASILCSLSESLESFVAMRVLQGVGGALMVPVGQLAVLRTTFKRQLITVIATLTWPTLVAFIIGPPLDGFITSYANRRWIFFINAPLGILAIALTLCFILDIHDDERRPFDIMGFTATAVAMVSLVYAMELLGTQRPQGWLTVGLLALGTVTFLPALHHFHRTTWLMIRFDAMNVSTFHVTMYGGSLFHASISTVPFLLPLMFQIGFGMNAFHAGSLVLAAFVGNLATKPATTSSIRWLGFKKLLLINGTLNVLALLACALITLQTPVWIILLVLYLGGVFRSIQLTGASTLAFADVLVTQMSYANTLLSTATQLAVGLGISLAATGIRTGDVVSEKLALGNIPGISLRLALVAIAIICLVGMVGTLWLTRNAGSAVSNRNR